jgi:hypothetical protein
MSKFDTFFTSFLYIYRSRVKPATNTWSLQGPEFKSQHCKKREAGGLGWGSVTLQESVTTFFTYTLVQHFGQDDSWKGHQGNRSSAPARAPARITAYAGPF